MTGARGAPDGWKHRRGWNVTAQDEVTVQEVKALMGLLENAVLRYITAHPGIANARLYEQLGLLNPTGGEREDTFGWGILLRLNGAGKTRSEKRGRCRYTYPVSEEAKPNTPAG
jgi:hypothetical protein